MTTYSPEVPLKVLAYGGTARSGKNTVVQEIAAQYPFVATDETGADYRLAVWSLLELGELEPGMPKDLVMRRVQAVGFDTLTAIVAARPVFFEAHTSEELHTPKIDDLVHLAGPAPVLRKAVKAGFCQRIENVRDSGSCSVLLVDGRNLAPVVHSVGGTAVVMDTFVTCSALEAAKRECNRQKIPLSSEKGQEVYMSILRRNNSDAQRPHDPVVPNGDAIDYWNPGIQTLHEHDYADPVLRGVGSLAVKSGRQVLFNTTFFRRYEDPRGSMVSAATQMFDEALERAASYVPMA